MLLVRVETLQERFNLVRETSADHVRTLDLDRLKRTLADFRQETLMSVEALTKSVSNMKRQIEITRGEVEKQAGELAVVKIDSVELRELITTNHDKLLTLERNRHNFRLVKSKRLQQVGPIGVKLRGTSPNRNRYSIKLVTNGKEIARRRMTLFEPVQFYVGDASFPHEFVVNKIEKGIIKGYLSTPKEPVVKGHFNRRRSK